MDSNEEKIYKLIEKNPGIHQKTIIDEIHISKNTVKKNLDKLREEKRIIGQESGTKTKFSISDYYASPDELIVNIEKTMDLLKGFVHSVIKRHKEYQFETLELLYVKIGEVCERLPYDVKNHERRLREDNDPKRDRKQYQECRREILKTMDEIVLEGSLKKRVCQYQKDAGGLFNKIVSLLYDCLLYTSPSPRD